MIDKIFVVYYNKSMDIKIVDYDQKYEKDINHMVNNQWNEKFIHDNNIIGKVALLDDKFAGTCFGWQEKDYFYLDTLCIVKDCQRKGIGTLLLESFIKEVNINAALTLN